MEALVTKSTGLWYEVRYNDVTYIARLRGKFKLQNLKLTNPIAVGDWVSIEPNQQVENEWVITAIHDRKNYVIRASPRKKRHDHLIASNIDQGVLIATLRSPRTSVGFIDRFSIALESFRIPMILIFNKSDLYKPKDMDYYEMLKTIYESIGYRVFLTSFKEDISDEVGEIFHNKVSLLAGHSGSGKSTLVNALIPEANQETNEISDFADKGVHTTTFAEMFWMDSGTQIIDTPGIKELGLSAIEEEELSHYFPELRKFLGACKFHNCLHVNEPGCAVKQAIGSEISPLRYESYLSMLSGSDNRK